MPRCRRLRLPEKGHARTRKRPIKSSQSRPDLAARTIADFGDQWQRYTDNEGYYGDVDILEGTFGPLLKLEEIEGKRVAEIGSGTGRIVKMLLRGLCLALPPDSAPPAACWVHERMPCARRHPAAPSVTLKKNRSVEMVWLRVGTPAPLAAR
jgi:hypothetical protein